MRPRQLRNEERPARETEELHYASQDANRRRHWDPISSPSREHLPQ